MLEIKKDLDGSFFVGKQPFVVKKYENIKIMLDKQQNVIL